MNSIETLNRAADNIRILTAAMVEKAKSGHPGGAMGGADFINVLFSKYLVYDPQHPDWINRDRFFLDPGHMSPMLYSVLSFTGKYSMDDLRQFRQWGSATPGHPEVNVSRGIENTSGPLGQGHTMAVGAAIAERFLVARFGEWMAHKTFAYISDGGIQEEISQGAGRLAGTLGLGNLIMYYDANEVQLSTRVEDVTTEDTAAKYQAWGWSVLDVDGHDAKAISDALEKAVAETEKPTLIIGHTIMAKGAVASDGSSMEGLISTHGQPLSAAGVDVERTICNLGGDPENPFVIFDETRQLYAERELQLKVIVEKRYETQHDWEVKHPDLALKLRKFFSGQVADVDYSSIEQAANKATRVASSKVLGVFAEKIENMIVSSADLSNSDKTDGFLKKTHAFRKGDFSGGFLQAGVSELTMACVMNGIALHGGIIPVCATFFVFSDYMKPAMRMSALQELPVKYVFTHDAFRVGEDGPTHQPIEQESQVRLLEELKNHSGRNSMLVLRPADVHETTVSWKLAMENTFTPTTLILSRQGIRNIDDHYSRALKVQRGAYVVREEKNPDIILVANGSEVATLLEAIPLLQEDGIRANVVSVPSVGLFLQQDDLYRNSVIPRGVPVMGLTAGLPGCLQRVVGADGVVFGLDHFGFSAPYTVLDEKFGFNANSVRNDVHQVLKR